MKTLDILQENLLVNRVKRTGQVNGNSNCSVNWLFPVESGVDMVVDGLECSGCGPSFPEAMLVVG